jgi:hypothetical protein
MQPETLLLLPGAFDTYLWQDASTMSIFDVQDFGTYSLTVTEYGCEDVASIYVMEIHDIQLRQGWGILSTYVGTTASFDVIMADLALTNTLVVKDEMGQVFTNYFGPAVNGIGNHIVGESYQYYMSQPNQLLTVYGSAVAPELIPLSLNAGYNYLGYLRKAAGPVDQIMSPIEGLIDILKDEDGKVYWSLPFGFLNQIGDMIPGKGYQIKLDGATNFTYPANSITFSKSNTYNAMPDYYTLPVSTGCNMTLGIPESSWGIEVQNGDELGIFDSKGKLVGAGVYANNNMAISLWGQNELSNSKFGLNVKESYTIELWSASNGTIQELIVTEWIEGDGTYRENSTAIVGKFGVAVNGELSLNNYPNPFHEVTVIRFNIPEDGNVRIELFNSIGEKLEVISNKEYTAGQHELQFNVGNLSVGNYFIRLETKGQTVNKAVQIIK